MANLYVDETIAPGTLASGAIVEISGDEAHHALRVARLRVGEQILIGDGAGSVGNGTVIDASKTSFRVSIESVRVDPAPAQRLVLVQALAKGDRDERAVEQATEFGVDVVVPWESARSVSRWSGKGGSGSEKLEKGVAKWRRIAREAAKQSLRSRVPEVRDPVTLAQIAAVAADTEIEVVALHPRSGGRLTAWAATDAAHSAREVWLVVGPEGGFTDDELDAIEAQGGHVLVLGDTVLRTSSAGPAALAVLGAALGRW